MAIFLADLYIRQVGKILIFSKIEAFSYNQVYRVVQQLLVYGGFQINRPLIYFIMVHVHT